MQPAFDGTTEEVCFHACIQLARVQPGTPYTAAVSSELLPPAQDRSPVQLVQHGGLDRRELGADGSTHAGAWGLASVGFSVHSRSSDIPDVIVVGSSHRVEPLGAHDGRDGSATVATTSSATTS